MPEPSPQFVDEAERLRVLESFSPDALDDDPELLAIVRFAAKLCHVPVAQVTLVEESRQRFLAGEGLEERETPREVSFCAHAMKTPELLEILDAERDSRFSDNILVTGPPGVRFYAGQPLISDEGAPLGALCVVDTDVHAAGLDDFQREGLAVLAQAVMRRLNARRAHITATREIEERDERLRRVIEGVPQIAWSADADGNFDYFNARWEELIGSKPPKVAEEWRQYVHPDDAENTFNGWYAAAEEGTDFEAEYRMLHADGKYRWVLSLGVPTAETAGEPLRWFGTITDIHETKQALEERDMLTNELSHRIKNIFAVVISLATLKVRKTPEHEPFARELTGVLRALGRAHEFVHPGAGIVQEKLQGLLQALFAPYNGDDDEPRVAISGVDADISPRAATPLALVFHELATNSAKYGALSADEGHVTLAVEDRGDELAILWTENGGPPPQDTGKTGFGSRLVEMSVRGQLEGAWERRFDKSGLVVALTVSKEAMAR
ncbi:PAS domain-containing protein [Aurantiacibacter marinus]|uniref:histidine kinase n=1 Tax=Aurantiacibacter marinus TaxID=874156 RepID=A0A0H0XQE8_9SPHN|nr:PAS domain-containing protein [Aurantiacibacter marinus]KLI64569.1 hypothetical protein AAV99_03115 [Aurantiacibacter marinus]